MAKVTPYQQEDISKKSQVAAMFDNIAGKYDFLNRFLSLGIDQYWRKKTLQELCSGRVNAKVLDIATGTGDLAIMLSSKDPKVKIIGADISEKMLEIGRQKIQKAKLEEQIEFVKADSEALPFQDEQFDGVMVAFGVRNYEDLLQGLTEMKRVLKPGGKMVVLEFSRPRIFPIKQIFQFYFRFILPLIGKVVSKDQRAYSYLFESVQHFPDFEQFEAILKQIGMQKTKHTPLTFGICNIYSGLK
ncbi:MAG: bifunctional demethylmenaquinone methyltransferase/2-methoxy-6-polyprenyl-1,4-benzoquinol methylase UbiE [Saprospiraceae bacterium]